MVDKDHPPEKVMEHAPPLRQRVFGFMGTEYASELYIDEVLDGQGRLQYLDKVGSVSGLVEVEEDYDYDPEHVQLNRRVIHNGS